MQGYARLISSLIFGALFCHPLGATDFLQAQSEFDSFKGQTNREFQAAKGEFKLYKQQLLAAFDQYKYQTAKIWGSKNTIMPNNRNWISYQNDLNHRSIVDFEKGTIDVEIAIDANSKISSTEAKKQLEQTIVNTLKQGADQRSLIELAKDPVSKPSGPAVLKDQIANPQGQSVNQSEYTELASQASMNAKSQKIKGDDGKTRFIYRAQLNLVPDHIKRRANKYLADVNSYSKKQKISPAIVFAIMETESMFNPVARSPVPAFGLMQLVPTSGARDAYRHIYKQDRIVSDRYLYNPQNNINLGTAFIHILYYNYLSGIKNDRSRQWAAIAAYNTGAGNIFRTFAGKYSRSKFGSRSNWKRTALNEINKMSSEQVYDFLRKHLPHKETRNYIKTVRNRINKYEVS
ncbi:MAG: murein transglycosylase domain-containing protein [Gammaproteobacteria bacterium]|nr:murein transglycosylase domain-containing protein [Gammaproteobacteria bacterium]